MTSDVDEDEVLEGLGVSEVGRREYDCGCESWRVGDEFRVSPCEEAVRDIEDPVDEPRCGVFALLMTVSIEDGRPVRFREDEGGG